MTVSLSHLSQQNKTGGRSDEKMVARHTPAPYIEYLASEPAVTCTAPAPVIEYVAPSITSTCATPALESSPAAAYAAPTPVSQNVAPTPAASHAADFSRMNKDQLTVAAAVAPASVTAALAEAEKPPSAKCWRSIQHWPTSLPKPSHLRRSRRRSRRQEEGEEQAREALTDGSSWIRVTAVRTGGMRERRGHPMRSQRVRRSGQSHPSAVTQNRQCRTHIIIIIQVFVLR